MPSRVGKRAELEDFGLGATRNRCLSKIVARLPSPSSWSTIFSTLYCMVVCFEDPTTSLPKTRQTSISNVRNRCLVMPSTFGLFLFPLNYMNEYQVGTTPHTRLHNLPHSWMFKSLPRTITKVPPCNHVTALRYYACTKRSFLPSSADEKAREVCERIFLCFSPHW